MTLLENKIEHLTQIQQTGFMRASDLEELSYDTFIEEQLITNRRDCFYLTNKGEIFLKDNVKSKKKYKLEKGKHLYFVSEYENKEKYS